MTLPLQLIVAFFFMTNGYCHRISQHEIEVKKCYEKVCWDESNYPAEEIMQKLEENGENLDTFGGYEKHSTQESMRWESSCNLCKHKVSLKVSPVTLLDEDVTYYVVRTRNYEQHITYNICESKQIQEQESRCLNIGENHFLLNHRMDCQQKFTTITLLVYDVKTKAFLEKTLQYPSACACTVQVDTD